VGGSNHDAILQLRGVPRDWDTYFLGPTTTVTSGLSLVKIIYKSALVSLLNCPEEQFGIVPQARESWGHVSRKIFTTSEIIASGSILA